MGRRARGRPAVAGYAGRRAEGRPRQTEGGHGQSRDREHRSRNAGVWPAGVTEPTEDGRDGLARRPGGLGWRRGGGITRALRVLARAGRGPVGFRWCPWLGWLL